jgi:uncharacterized protein
MKKRLLLTGSSGFLGQSIAAFFQSHGYEVTLTSRKEKPGTLSIDYEQVPEDLSAFEGFDLCIHLCGENITGRWTKAKKKRIYDSRIGTTRFLVELFSRLSKPPKAFFSASATGYYGDGEDEKTEESRSGALFLSQVCREWEESAKRAEKLGIKVSLLRFGVVLGDGGVVAKMRLPFKLGLGCVMGDGEQFISWIHSADLARAILFVAQKGLTGAVNFSAPHPVRQKEFAKCLAKSLGAPLFIKLPGWFFKLLFGQMADEIFLSSVRAYPEKLLKNGFTFAFETLEPALADIFPKGVKKKTE